MFTEFRYIKYVNATLRMEGGTSTGLYILVGIVIFAIFLGLVWWFFEGKIKPMLDTSMNKAETSLNKGVNGDIWA